ncbi:hypothetical protein [Alkalihalobacillus pseudalcaliphilus]|uniref:hypothetical protein n=1 Tax=Alkalihalobacillus pseudalcaliphilus TaxID=79884 RepID=UPI00064D9370|nr:hypothetical protein [Alkalihalobacillus pseudalcaliphilus]KMK74583.1 hypothetical protein AB990_18945 [Alkalihalobacillus pseudalcaliphilus]
MRKIIISFLCIMGSLIFVSPATFQAESDSRCDMEVAQGKEELLVTLKAHKLIKPFHYRFEIIDAVTKEVVESGKTLTAFQESKLMRGFELKKGRYILKGEIVDQSGQTYTCEEKKWDIES